MTSGTQAKHPGRRNAMRILVTGNLGYVGSHLVEILVKAGHDVIGCDLSLFPEAVCGDLIKPGYQLNKDFRLITEEDLLGIDAIAHLAGLSNDPMGELNPGLTMQVNGIGTLELAKRAKKANVKIFAFASSCSIYGNTSSLPRTEVDETAPLSEYATSKLFAENGLKQLASDQFQVYLLRNATAYGDSKVFRSDLVVNDLSAGMTAFGVAEIKSDGSPWRPFIHCKDMARAFKLFIEENPTKTSGVPVNVGFKEENFQIKDIGNMIEKIWESGKISLNSNAIVDPRDYKVDFTKLENLFPSFRPEHPLEFGIHELKTELINMNYSPQDHDSKKYVRLPELKKNISKLES
jgi:nucleoside-diphosphate-sugar epimerase